jgi:hypothetical protein
MGAPFQVAGNDAAMGREAQACLELRIAGYSFRRVAEEMTRRGTPMGTTTAFRRVEWALQQILTPGVEELRRMEGERLDVAMRALLPGLEDGNVQAVQAWIKLSESRRRLFGLDAPVKIDATVTETTQVDIELDEMIREVRAANEAAADEAVRP